MILGVGTDIVNVSRFLAWQEYPEQKLARIFTAQELNDCYSTTLQKYIPEKLAARFAAKEAFFKALSAMLISLRKTKKPFTFLTMCPQVHVEKDDWDVPMIMVKWDFFQELIQDSLPPVTVSVSFAHEQEYAVAFVVISDRP